MPLGKWFADFSLPPGTACGMLLHPSLCLIWNSTVDRDAATKNQRKLRKFQLLSKRCKKTPQLS